jgi:hypothetical protein
MACLSQVTLAMLTQPQRLQATLDLRLSCNLPSLELVVDHFECLGHEGKYVLPRSAILEVAWTRLAVFVLSLDVPKVAEEMASVQEMAASCREWALALSIEATPERTQPSCLARAAGVSRWSCQSAILLSSQEEVMEAESIAAILAGASAPLERELESTFVATI